MSGRSASDTRAATALEEAITAYRAYLETGIARHRSVPNIGNIDCIEFVGVDAVAQLQDLRKRLRDAVESSYHAPTLAPSADLLATKIPSLWQVDRELNSGVIHIAESRSEKSVPFAEFVRADVLDVLDKALARLKGTAHSGPRANKGNRPKRVKRTEATGEGLRIDEAARLAYWNRKRLQINAQADFEVLRKLQSAGGVIASHVDLFRALKPDKIDGSVEALTTAPPEVKEAISHIRKALRTLGCPYRIETVKQHGYRLRSPDE